MRQDDENLAAMFNEIYFIFTFKTMKLGHKFDAQTFSMQHISIISTSQARSKGVSLPIPMPAHWRLCAR